MYSLFFLLFLPSFSSTVVGEASFDFESFTTLTNLKISGDAHFYNNTVRLTGELGVPNSGAGMVLYNNSICQPAGRPNPMSFTTHFAFSIVTLNPNSGGGGLAFVISPDNELIGPAGRFLGIPAGANGVEFDTAKDIELNDINGNHVGIDINSVVSLKVANLNLVNISLKNGGVIHAWVDHSGPNHHTKVYVSYDRKKPLQPVLEATADLSLCANGGSVFVGFSGTTEASTEAHSLISWRFRSFFEDPTSINKGGLNPPPPMATMSTTPFTGKNNVLKKVVLPIGLSSFVAALLGLGALIYYGGGGIYVFCCICCSRGNNRAGSSSLIP